MKALFFTALLSFLSGCSTSRNSAQKNALLIEKLTGFPLTEPVNERRVDGFEDRPWQWRGRNKIGAPPQSYVAARFINEKDALIATLGGGLSLVDTWLGTKVWEREIAVGVGAQVAFDKNFVYVAGMDRILRKLRISSGEQVWEMQLSAESTGGVLLAAPLLYVTAADNSLWAVDPEAGKSLWTYKRPNSQKSALWSLRGSATPKLSSDRQRLYLGFADGYFVALKAMTGDTIWEKNFERPGRFVDADVDPVLSQDGKQIFLSLVDGDFVALDAANGAVQWKLPNASHAAPLLDEAAGMVYYTTNDGKIVKASMRSGSIFWSVNLGDRGVASTPATLGPKLLGVTTTRFGFIVFDRESGKELFADELGSGILTPPSFHEGKVLILSPRNDLFIYRVRQSS